jgi:hypothetical protein
MLSQGLGQVFAKDGAINCQCAPRRNRVFIRLGNYDRTQLPEFVVEQARSAIAGHCPKGVAAHQLCQMLSVVSGASAVWAHFVEHDG